MITISVDEHITLKTWQESDAPALFSLVEKNRTQLLPWLPWVPNVCSFTDSLEFIQTSSSDPQSGKGVEMGIWSGDQLIGCIGLHEFSKEHHKTSVGYWLDSAFQGQGIMTKSVQRLIDFCFTELDIHRVELRAATENMASQHIAERLGFVKEGILREVELVNGRFLDNVVYGKLKKEDK